METRRRVIPRCHLSRSTLLLTIALLATSWSAAKAAPVSSYLQAVFSPESEGGLNHFLISNASGDTYVYVGALSMVYQLAPNLDVERNDTVSVCNPADDSNCEDPPFLNDNKILAVAPDPKNRLVMCRGSDGTCEFRFLNDLTVDDNVPTSTVFGQVTASQLNTPALVASYTSEQFVLFAAASFALDDNRERPPMPISFKTLSEIAPFNVFAESDEFLEGNAVTYLNTFEWNDFIFVTVSVQEGAVVEKSRLGRVCVNGDPDMDFYSEIPLSCGSYDTIQTGYLGTDDTFYALFTDGTQSALCSYGMQDIQNRFLDALCDCVSSQCVRADGISYLVNQFCPNEELQEFVRKQFLHCNL